MVGLSSERLIMGMHNRFEVALETKRIIDCLQKGNFRSPIKAETVASRGVDECLLVQPVQGRTT
jgi:hypothetical protein